MNVRTLFGFGLAAVIASGVAGCVPSPAGRATATPAPATASGSVGESDPPPPSEAESAPTASPSFIRPTPGPSPTFLVHEVNVGESLTSIARLYGTTARSIAYWNRARYPSLDPDSSGYAPNRIEVGWILQLIPTEVVDEDDLPDATPTPTPQPSSPFPSVS